MSRTDLEISRMSAPSRRRGEQLVLEFQDPRSGELACLDGEGEAWQLH